MKLIGKKLMGKKHWLDNADSWICPICGFETSSPAKYEGCKCPKCGFQDEKDKMENER
jgi:rubredoxin